MFKSGRNIILPLALMLFLSGNIFGQQLFLQDTLRGKPIIYKDTKDAERYLKPAAIITPTAFLLYGCLKPAITGIQNVDDNLRASVLRKYPTFNTHAADYLMWAPSVALYAMDAVHVKTKHSFKEQLFLEAGSLIITGGAGLLMRKISGNMDVYTKHGTKFPSGHTANAFRGAEIFHQELKADHKFLSYAGYVVAAGVGTLRIINKDHLLTEVVAGAGLGILSTKLTYWLFEKVQHKNAKRYKVQQ